MDSFKAKHFKFLGRWIHYLVHEKEIKEKIRLLLLQDMELIDGAKINGFMKLWLYQFYVLSHLSWPFMINDLNKTFAQELQRTINPRLKKWAGIGKTVDNGLLFDPNKNLVWV